VNINGIQSRKDIEELRKAQITQSKTITQLAEENKDLKEDYKALKDAFELFKNDFVKALEFQKLEIKTQSVIKRKKKRQEIRIAKEKEET